jgi:hypothetical protein
MQSAKAVQKIIRIIVGQNIVFANYFMKLLI